MSTTVHLVMQVDEVVGARDTYAHPSDDIVHVGLSLGPKVALDSVRQELGDLGRVVVFVKAGHPAFEYDTTLLSIAEEGGTLGVVHSDESIAFPALEAQWLVPDDFDMPALREASATTTEIAVTTRNGSWSRLDS
jgi:hypothetical protein